MSANYNFIERTGLAATCILEGAERFVRVEAKAWLDVGLLMEHEPKLFRKISDDIERGYRTTEDYPLVRVEDAFLKHCGAKWEMSYFGKAKLSTYVRDRTRRVQLKGEVQGLVELMQSKVEFYTTVDDYLVCTSEVTKEQKPGKNGRMRSVPVIDHQFQQLRPLLQRTLKETQEERLVLRRLWAERPRIPLDWR